MTGSRTKTAPGKDAPEPIASPRPIEPARLGPRQAHVSAPGGTSRRWGTGWVLPVVVLGAGLLLTAVGVVATSNALAVDNELAFAAQSDAARTAVERRVDAYSEVLIGLRSLFAVKPDATRGEFHDHIAIGEISERYPGVQALEFTRYVRTSEAEAFVEAVRSDTTLNAVGYPEFEIHPATDAEEHFVVDYVEPLGGNEAAFGFDLGSNPVRLVAVEQARDTGQAVATAPIRLVQETEQQIGFLLLLPVYDSPTAPDTVEHRRETFIGFVNAVFRVGDMLEGVLGANPSIELEIYDGGDAGQAAQRTFTSDDLLFDGDGDLGGLANADADAWSELEIGGRRWVLHAQTLPGARSGAERILPWVIALGGFALSLTMLIAVRSLGRSRERAERMADTMTADLRDRSEELRLANDALATSNEELGRFATVAAHDLQEPLRKVQAFGDRLIATSGDALDARGQEYVQRMRGAASRMQALIEGLLAFSRVTANPNAFERVDLNAIVGDVIDYLQAAFDESHVSIQVEELPSVHADPIQMTQLFQNLLSNAIKYRREGVVSAIEVSGSMLNGEAHRPECEIKVADNGIGFNDEYAEKIFGMFERLHGRTEYPGTGIGLALCRKIVTRHGGSITATSIVGERTEFILTLPSAEGAEA